MATRTIGNETVLLNLDTGIYFGLDAVGSRFIQILESKGTLAEVHRLMLEEYNVKPEVLEADLLRLADEMISKGLLEPGS